MGVKAWDGREIESISASTATSSAALLVGRAAAIVISLGQLRILTHFLSDNEVGAYFILLTAASCVSLLVLNPLDIYVQRHIASWKRTEAARMWLRLWAGWAILIGVASAFVFTLLQPWLRSHTSQEALVWPLAVALGGIVAFERLANSTSVYFNLLGRHWTFVFAQNLYALGRLLAIATAVLWLGSTGSAAVIGLATWSLIAAVALGWLLWRAVAPAPGTGHGLITARDVRDVVRFGLPLAATSILYWLQSQGYRFSLEQAAGGSVVGRFAILYGLAAVLLVGAETLFQQTFLPRLYALCSTADERSIKAWDAYAERAATFFIPVAVFIGCTGQVLVTWLLAPEYRNLGALVWLAALAELFRVFYSVVYVGGVAFKRTEALVIPGFIAALLMVGGAFATLIAPPLPTMGAVAAVANFGFCALAYRAVRAHARVSVPWKAARKATRRSIPFVIFPLLATYVVRPGVLAYDTVVILVATLYLARIVIPVMQSATGGMSRSTHD